MASNWASTNDVANPRTLKFFNRETNVQGTSRNQSFSCPTPWLPDVRIYFPPWRYTAKHTHLRNPLSPLLEAVPDTGQWESVDQEVHGPPPLPKTPNKNLYPFLNGAQATFGALALCFAPSAWQSKAFPFSYKTLFSLFGLASGSETPNFR